MALSFILAALAQAAAAPAPAAPIWCDPFMVFFDEGTRMSPQSRQVIANIASAKHQVRSHMTVSGHADARGSEAYNLLLSRRRAEAVKAALVAAGVPGYRIRVEAFGETRLLIETEVDRPENRRAEICFY
ncbi:OmpA family protein [Sphingomonas parva]|uniref:OmpA family protein n=1 Tax=Sphingomonas parva TaxID=2555898 RepID=A0A4Y8ZSL7_9SPHN|nr:OmpA family protein [Sphingomonas parva]TFI57446.1 OmpA family protein [Sphingomonas parva]